MFDAIFNSKSYFLTMIIFGTFSNLRCTLDGGKKKNYELARVIIEVLISLHGDNTSLCQGCFDLVIACVCVYIQPTCFKIVKTLFLCQPYVGSKSAYQVLLDLCSLVCHLAVIICFLYNVCEFNHVCPVGHIC